MMLLRVKVDTTLNQSGLTDQEKYDVRVHRQRFFMTFPAERLWFYIKISRNMNKFDSDDFKSQIADLELEGIEDEYVKCELRFLHAIIYQDVAPTDPDLAIADSPNKRDYLVPMMYFQAMT